MNRYTFIIFSISFIGTFLLFTLFKGSIVKNQNLLGVESRSERMNPSASPQVRSSGPEFIPVSLVIPRMRITSPIEIVGLTGSGEVDAPQNAAHAGWFDQSAFPGKEGRTLLTGLYETPSGKAALFHTLDALKSSDEIEVIHGSGEKAVYRVSQKMHTEVNQKPNEIIPQEASASLALITTDLVRDRHTGSLSRIVVYAVLKEITKIAL